MYIVIAYPPTRGPELRILTAGFVALGLQAQFIAQSIGQAFQVAYMEFLKANGIEDNSFVKEMDYQEVLNSQEIFGDELQMFAKKEMQKEVGTFFSVFFFVFFRKRILFYGL